MAKPHRSKTIYCPKCRKPVAVKEVSVECPECHKGILIPRDEPRAKALSPYTQLVFELQDLHDYIEASFNREALCWWNMAEAISALNDGLEQITRAFNRLTGYKEPISKFKSYSLEGGGDGEDINNK